MNGMMEYRQCPTETELTLAQRRTVRKLLDRFFDADALCYLDGKDGRAIADEAGVPLSILAKYREDEYGRIPTVIDLQRDAITGARALLAKMATEVELYKQDFGKAIVERVNKVRNELLNELNEWVVLKQDEIAEHGANINKIDPNFRKIDPHSR